MQHEIFQTTAVAGRPRVRPAAPLPMPWLVWRSVKVPLPAMFALAGILMLQGTAPDRPVEEPASVAAERAASTTRDAASSQQGVVARMVREPRFSVALPSGWRPVDPPAGAALAAQPEDGGAWISVRVMRDPDLPFATFAKRARGAFGTGMSDGRAVEVKRLEASRGNTAKLVATPAPGEPDHRSLLLSRGPLRYQLTTSLAPGVSPRIRRQTLLINNSFTPEDAG